MSDPSFVVLISGTGSNLQAIIDATQSKKINARLSAVISNKPDAPGLNKATNAEYEAKAFDTKKYSTKQDYDDAVIEYIDTLNPDLIVLAGYMRILTDKFVEHFQNKILNIHPSLLPKYKGLHTHKRALEAGDAIHGVSVHLVCKELDSGQTILQAETNIRAEDDENTLAARILTLEHKIYPLVIQWYFEERLQIKNEQIYFDKQSLDTPIQWTKDKIIFP